MRRSVIVLAALAACSSDGDRPRRRPPPPPAGDAAVRVEPAVAAIGEVSYLEPALQRAFDPASFTALSRPAPGDWLAEHPETPQTFDVFLDARTNVPDARRHVIYLLPIGTFPPGTPPISALVDVVHAFFQIDVETLPAVRVGELGVSSRISPTTGKRQLLAGDVLKWLVPRVPEDGFAVMAITMEDLYPDPKWNFVFGMASLSERVGVQSFARQDPAFLGEPRTAGWEHQLLRRATWTLVHEIAHMFGLSHCVHWRCVINGANHQAEADGAPLHPCPVCLRKLWSAIKFDPAAREDALAATLRKLGIDDEAAWSEHRAAWIRTGAR